MPRVLPTTKTHAPSVAATRKRQGFFIRIRFRFGFGGFTMCHFQLDARWKKWSGGVDFPYVGTHWQQAAAHGSVPAKAAWSIPAETARGDDLACFRPQTRHFILIAASDG